MKSYQGSTYVFLELDVYLFQPRLGQPVSCAVQAGRVPQVRGGHRPGARGRLPAQPPLQGGGATAPMQPPSFSHPREVSSRSSPGMLMFKIASHFFIKLV